MKKRMFLTIGATLLSVFGVMASEIGFTTGVCDRNTVFSVNNTKKQGQAIRLSHEKLQLLKGQAISAVNVAFGSRNTVDNKATLFIGESLDGVPAVSQEVTISKANAWLAYELETPYVITGDEPELYIGFTASLVVGSYKVLTSDRQADLLEGCTYVYDGLSWFDMSGLGYGAANVRIVVGDASFTDVVMKRAKFDGYYKSGEQYEFANQLFNFGTTTIGSFDVELSVGDGEPQTLSFPDANLAPNAAFDFTLPEYTATSTGDVALRITVKNINGSTDDDTSDNAQNEQVFFYPANMERSLLIEEFTGQDCSACPAGHTTLHNVLATVDFPYVEVSHHAVYYPDMFTMVEDEQYTFFYDGGSTYAPAVMVNRSTPTGYAAPVSSVSKSVFTEQLNYALASKPYASLKLQSTFDPATREATVTLSVQPHTTMPTPKSVLNVMLVQDNLQAFQSNGGSLYNHVNVFRGTLTENAWGLLADFTPGQDVVWSKTFTLPEAIRSSYWTEELLPQKGYTEADITWTAVPEDLRVVAYVAAYDSESNKRNQVYNCVAVNLGSSYVQAGFDESLSGIDNVRSDAGRIVNVRVENRRIRCDEASSIRVYGTDGRLVDAAAQLPAGIYVACLMVDGQWQARKVVIN